MKITLKAQGANKDVKAIVDRYDALIQEGATLTPREKEEHEKAKRQMENATNMVSYTGAGGTKVRVNTSPSDETEYTTTPMQAAEGSTPRSGKGLNEFQLQEMKLAEEESKALQDSMRRVLGVNPDGTGDQDVVDQPEPDAPTPSEPEQAPEPETITASEPEPEPEQEPETTTTSKTNVLDMLNNL